jgi:Tol biopolymer transport system component
VPPTPTSQQQIGERSDKASETPPTVPSVNKTVASQESEETPATSPLDWLEKDRPLGVTLPADLAGLVYDDRDALWLVDEEGRSVQVLGKGYSGVLSPEGAYALYSNDMDQGEDIFLVDLNSEETRQLTDTANIFERSFQWWPERPGTVVYNYAPDDQLGPWSGYLGAVDIESGERIVLDDQSIGYGSFATSPDGRRILYDNASQPMLLIWGQEPIALSTEAWGLDFEGYVEPAWSPDGAKIAFHASRLARSNEGGGVIRALVIVDMESQTARVLHQYTSIGQRGGPDIQWSPNGKWIAVVNFSETGTSPGATTLWVVRADGSGDVNLGYATEPVWSPDGNKLIYTQWPAPNEQEGTYMQDAHITVVEAGVWQPREIEPLLGYIIKDWIDISSIQEADDDFETSAILSCPASNQGSAEDLACIIQEALLQRDLTTLQPYMADPFIIGYWGSEGKFDTPEGIIQELNRYRLPPDTSRLSFTTDRSQFPPLAGQPPETLFGPDLNIAQIVYSEGWGPDGLGAALLYIAQESSGEYYFHSIAYSGQTHFDQ